MHTFYITKKGASHTYLRNMTFSQKNWDLVNGKREDIAKEHRLPSPSATPLTITTLVT